MNDLKIFAPASNLNEIEFQLNEGADELYIGLIDSVWAKKYHRYAAAVISPNRREGLSYNFSAWDELEKAVNIVHKANKSISFALNAHCYSNETLDDLRLIVDNVYNLNFDYLIIEDPFLLDYFIMDGVNKTKINLSGDTMVLNSQSAKWFQKKGVSRITFPQNITLKEIEIIARQNPMIEFEVFMLNGKCIFNSGTCFCMHGFRFIDGNVLPPLCANIAAVRDCNSQWFQKRIQGITCGVCAIPFLRNIDNIKSLKIVGRDITSSSKMSLTKFMKMILSTASDSYQEIYCQYFGTNKSDCQNKINCIYHEV